MELSFTEKKIIRKNFGKLRETLSIPNLIEVQKKSYSQFIQPHDSKFTKGLHKVFSSIFLLKSYQKKQL